MKKVNVTPTSVDLLKFLGMLVSFLLILAAVAKYSEGDDVAGALFFWSIPSLWILCILLITCIYVMAACKAILRGEKQVEANNQVENKPQ